MAESWGTAENVLDEFGEWVGEERERYRNGGNLITNMDAVPLKGDTLIDGNRVRMGETIPKTMVEGIEATSLNIDGMSWEPKGEIFISSGQMPKISEDRSRLLRQAKLYVTGTYADNRLVGGEYLMAAGRRRKRLAAVVALSVVEDRIGDTPEGRSVVKVLRNVLARCKEKRGELEGLSGRGSEEKRMSGLEQVAGMELMVYRCINKLMEMY